MIGTCTSDAEPHSVIVLQTYITNDATSLSLEEEPAVYGHPELGMYEKRLAVPSGSPLKVFSFFQVLDFLILDLNKQVSTPLM